MDIAELGFRVNTAQLEEAARKLDGVKDAAAGVATSASRTASIVEGASNRILSAKVAIARADQAEATAALKRLQVSKESSKEDLAAARILQQKTKSVLADALAEQKRAKALMESTAAQKAASAANRVAFGSSTTSIGSFRTNGPALAVNNGPSQPAIPRDAMPNRFNTANIAAQFQDIGVTAAMGMNPMIIALQQGTQLAAIMNSMEKPLQGIAVAFKQVFNATSLWTIGIVGVIAVLLQFVNWAKVAQTLLYGLADAIQFLLPYVAGLSAALALLYSRTIITGLASIITYMITLGATALATGAKMAMAWIIGLGPIGWIAAAVIALGAVFQAFGFNVLGYVKKAVNGITGAFVGAFESIKAVWKVLPAVMGDIVISTANMVLKKIGDMINGFIDMINGLVDSLPEWAKPEGGKITWKAELQLDNPFEGQAAAAGRIAGEEFKKAMSVDYVGQASQSVQSIADSVAGKIRSFASGIGSEDKKKKDPWEELVKGAERKIATMKAEAEAVGMSAQAAARLKYETELLNEAQQKNIKLSPEQRARIQELATGMASAEENARRLKEAFEFGKDTFKGFFSDIKQGLIEGKSLWESFGNAVTNVLNKIFDKILNSGVNMIFDALFPSSGGGAGGGIFGSLFSDLGSFLFSAKGNAFDQGGVTAFAKGGAFTNSVVNRTTPFAFASGGAFGVMGEAGPEAVMPLHRGPDGSLGVRAASNDNGGGGNVVVNVINNGNSTVKTEQHQTSSGMEIDVMIDQAVSQKISTQGSETNRALNTFNNRRLISR